MEKTAGNHVFFVFLQSETTGGHTHYIMNDSEIVTEEILEAMGLSRAAYEEILTIMGRMPTVDELSTLLAMWHTQGGKQGLLSWLRGQPHSSDKHDFLESPLEPEARSVREPRVKECIDIARRLFGSDNSQASSDMATAAMNVHRGDAIYMVGDVSEFFVDSEYGRQYLHLVGNPVAMDDEEETAAYLELILGSLEGGGIVFGSRRIAAGGLFGSLLTCTAPQRLGFDILTCREVRLDAFLFGERGVRFITVLDEPHEDIFLLKLSEARVNCCFLGRVTKGRILIDDMDFGPVSRYNQIEN